MTKPTGSGRTSITRVGISLIMAPLFAIVGAFVAVVYLPRVLRWVGRLPLFWADTLTCPNGHPNALAARWECTTCHGQYLGWVGKCSVCGSNEVDWFPCETCELAVVLPWRRFD